MRGLRSSSAGRGCQAEEFGHLDKSLIIFIFSNGREGLRQSADDEWNRLQRR